MTALALRYPSRDRHARSHDPTGIRFGRDVHGNRGESQMPESGMTKKMEEIRARIQRDAYDVDATKVADAIVERLLAERTVPETTTDR